MPKPTPVSLFCHFHSLMRKKSFQRACQGGVKALLLVAWAKTGIQRNHKHLLAGSCAKHFNLGLPIVCTHELTLLVHFHAPF